MNGFAREPRWQRTGVQGQHVLKKRINFVSTRGKELTPNPPGWEAYDGAVYSQERGYGWVSPLTGFHASDGGEDGKIILANGKAASARLLGRPELANWQGTHRENRPLVFRIDLPDGWYRVRCASVAHVSLPLVDQRSFKCRAHDSIFAGPLYGPPLRVRGQQLVEGSHKVEVTEGHLRVVVGDPAYGGWTWSHRGPWYSEWNSWIGKWGNHRYAESWHQKLTRTVDPGFHHLRLNSLEIEKAPGPTEPPVVLFKDFFNRDDSPDINSGVADSVHWKKIVLNPSIPQMVEPDLYKTSIRLTAWKTGKGMIGLVQPIPSPPAGMIRYSTRMSLFTGEGSKLHSGSQEAGLLILGEPAGPNEFNTTFIGVSFDRSRTQTPGWIKYRVGDGRDGYQTDVEIPDTSLPFKVTEGEYEIVADHDARRNTLNQIRINGVDLTPFFPASSRKQRISRGFFGIRAAMDPLGSGVQLRQFYWYYRVEEMS